MGNALTAQPDSIIIAQESVLKDYKNATIEDYHTARENYASVQAAYGDKMAISEEEFDEIFSLMCQDTSEHFAMFDPWRAGKIDVMEVFAVAIVYCKSTIEEKIPLLFDLFDFDHSKEISNHELVLLMICSTRGLCKVVGLDRPSTFELEAMAVDAFATIDRDHNGQISLREFSDWALKEPNLIE
ncbi:TPA: hypothetical protein N0F65_013045, partial [Lagenidium giganteum]